MTIRVDRMRKEASLHKVRYHPRIRLQRMRETAKELGQDRSQAEIRRRDLQNINQEYDRLYGNVHCAGCIRPMLKSKVKDSRNRPGVAQRVPGGLGSQIS